MIHERAPWFDAQTDQVSWTTTVLFERKLVDTFGRERIWLAGDAAHVTGPIGTQSMNVGLREARDLAERVSATHKGGSLELLERYGDERRNEWEELLGKKGGIGPVDDCAAWVRNHATRILSCVPASGARLRALLGLTLA